MSPRSESRDRDQTPTIPVVDLHCDLPIFLALGELQGEQRTPFDRRSRVAVPQLRDGGVVLQTLAIFTAGGAGIEMPTTVQAERQVEAITRLHEQHDDVFRPIRTSHDLVDDGRIGLIPALESATGLAESDEPLQQALRRLDSILETLGPLLYISLTWISENRFGGGNGATKGLTEDGRVLLEYMNERGVPVDVSHASPRLAHDIMDTTYARGWQLPVLASHSPYAGIKEIPRNLPDEIALEIARRQGVIGLNVMCRYMVGDAPQSFVDQIVYARELGVLGAQALGADYFYAGDVPGDMRPPDPDFYDDFGDASTYPALLEAVRHGAELDQATLDAIAHGNALRFMRRVLEGQSK